MAQLDIERKSHNSMWWLWLLIALVIILAIWWFVWGSPGDRVAATATDSAAVTAQATDTFLAERAAPPAASVIGSAGAVTALVDFASRSRADSMSIDHIQTATGLRDLAAAGEALASSAADTAAAGATPVAARADSLRSYADQLQQNAESARHADLARRGFIVGANMLRDLQAADNATADELDEVRRTAEAIRPATPLLEQRTAVQRYWNAVASAITDEGGN